MTDDYSEDPEFIAFADRALEELVPKLQASGINLSLVPDEASRTDIKFALELGLTIMMDKPIVLVVQPGTSIPERLRRVADDILEGDLNTAEGQALFHEALSRALERLGIEGDDHEDRS